MTSLIFGSIYLGHQGWVHHRQEKQRRKNYERWEGLRDEYDEQKKYQRESRSLDIQRTGLYDNGYGYGADDRPILTLRDQQEANDARTGWRPQESWETNEERRLREDKTGYQPVTADGGRQQERRSMDVGSSYAHRPQDHRTVSLATGYDQMRGDSGANGATLAPSSTQPAAPRLKSNKTGAVWDEGLPPPIRVPRRNWEQQNGSSTNVSRNPSQRASQQPSAQPPATPFDQSNIGSHAGSHESLPRPDKLPEAEENQIAGGIMAELIEGGRRNVSVPVQRSNNPFEQPSRVAAPVPLGNGPISNNPFEPNNRFDTRAQKAQTPGNEKDMMEWWK